MRDGAPEKHVRPRRQRRDDGQFLVDRGDTELACVARLAEHMRRYGSGETMRRIGRKKADGFLASADPIRAAHKAGWKLRNNAEIAADIEKYKD